MDVSEEFLARVVAAHAPVLFLHPADAYMPCTVEFFLQHSALVVEGAVGAPRGARSVVIPRGGVTQPALLRAQERCAPGARLALELDPAARQGCPKESLSEVPLYAHAKAVLRPDDGTVEALEVTYMTFYAYNGSYDVGGLGLLHAGAHDGDWEHLTARIDPSSGELLGIWYAAHRPQDGMWVEGHRVPRTPDGRPAAYVALHGHGTYPRAGLIHRHFWCANDRCSGEGPVWRPARVVLLPALHGGPPPAPTDAADGGPRPAPAAAVRSLVGLPSRGSRLRAAAAAAAAAVTAAEDGSSSSGGGDGGPELPEVITDDPCLWAFFRGQWGTIDAPVTQAWMREAEPPVSRTPLLRLFGHWVKGSHRV